MATFDHIIPYEDWGEIRTSRWSLTGIKTKTGSLNVDSRGWLWFSASTSGDTMTVTVYKDAAGASSVATGSGDVSGVDTAPVEITLAQANSSGISGTVWIEETEDDVTTVPLFVTALLDKDIELEYKNAAGSHMSNYDSTSGYADYCAAATKHVLMKVSHLHSDELGGYGAREMRYAEAATRKYPDYRVIANPLQLQEAALYWAMSRIFAALDETKGSVGSMYATKAERCQEMYDSAVASWSLSLNTDPDSDEDADTSTSPSVVHMERV